MAASVVDMSSSSLKGLVDLERFPLDDLDAPAGQRLLAECRSQLAEDGCVVLKQFIPQAALGKLEEETDRLSPSAHFNQNETNPYNSNGDDRLPQSHPKNRFDDRTNGFVAGDRIDEQTIIRRLYRHPQFQRFIASVVGMETIHEYADPLADLVVNVLREGCQHPWHYDTNEFIVTLLTRKPEDGGKFEYAPGIRSPQGENFEGVEQVLDGNTEQLKSLELQLGDLQIFFGRYSLHRVTPVVGDRERHTVIFAYAKEPGFVGRPERAQRIFGRMASVHERMLHEGAARRSDALSD
ncbi:HalD/BesD family halogenase [Salinicola rhizosphaerae]|uniref:Fe2OG dioxygenase domain-containing protein n=1 Tax=Salinicola rhizosphaerae TaxID=1443141 RepID=A0ABQ3DPP9_9GAMM|nr:hypothetical protein [Salinicola rhizosphaerae]GHB07152.1 hypothetical protein GCM10009038_00420 [Salinicola rhizosphaerae]